MNRKQKRMEDARVAKDKKMKKVAVAGAVVLAVVLAFEVPGMLKGSGGGSATPPASTAPATTAPGTAAAAVAPVASAKLPNSDTSPRAGKAQLYAFSHFASKDPFVQQINSAPPSSTSAGASSTSAGSQSTSIATPTGTAAAVRGNQSTRTLAVRGAARISVNGRVQVVRVGASFPSANPLFRLVSVGSNGVARIGIASGSYSSGARTVSLVTGRTLTLVDTADGIRYQLRLLG